MLGGFFVRQVGCQGSLQPNHYKCTKTMDTCDKEIRTKVQQMGEEDDDGNMAIPSQPQRTGKR